MLYLSRPLWGGFLIGPQEEGAGDQESTAATEQFIRDSGARLSESGRLSMVANAFINYLPRLREHFPMVKILNQNPQYRIYEARKT